MKGRVRFCDRSVLISFVYGYYDERFWEGLGPPGVEIRGLALLRVVFWARKPSRG